MLIPKLCRLLSAITAIGAMAEVSHAGCNCSAPPAPASYSGASMTAPAWSGNMGYGMNYGAGYGMGYGNSYGMSPGSMSATAYGVSQYGNSSGIGDTSGPHWAPGGYEPRTGSPVYYHDPAGGEYVNTGNPYYDHFGPGYQRGSIYGHYRFPYYNYRTPWYYPGRAVYNRDTNLPW